MSDTLSIWEEILKTIQTLTTGPLIVFYLVLLFRRALTQQIPGLFKSLEALAARLVSLKYKGIEADFQMQALRKFAAGHSPELSRQLLLKIGAPPDTQTVLPRTFGIAPTDSLAAAGSAEEKVLTALSGDLSGGKTVSQISTETDLPTAAVDTALTGLLQKDSIEPAFSPQNEIVFTRRT